MPGYLPKESPNTRLNKTILRTLWNNTLISKSLGIKNEDEAREWFRNHQEAHERFEEWNRELEKKIKELQSKASEYLSSLKKFEDIKEGINLESYQQVRSQRNKV